MVNLPTWLLVASVVFFFVAAGVSYVTGYKEGLRHGTRAKAQRYR